MSTYVSPTIEIHRVLVTKIESNTMNVPVTILHYTREANRIVESEALIDCRAGGNFIDLNYAKRTGLPLIPLERPIVAYNVDGTQNKKGTIRYKVDLPLEVNGRRFRTELLATGLGRQKLILGFPWLQEQNPIINWLKGTMEWRPNEALQRFLAGVRKRKEE